MSSRPFLAPFQSVKDGDMSGDIVGAESIIQMIPLISYVLKWTGSPVGVFSVEISNDYKRGANGDVINAGTWVPVSLSVPAEAIGSSGDGCIHLTDIAAYAIRLKYTRTSGSGTLNATVSGKVK